MNKLTTLISTVIATVILAAPTWASAAPASASCSVEVNHVVNGTVIETYTKDFAITRGMVFVDDFSEVQKQKRFTATLARVDGHLVVSNK
ncbi:MAG: hypothetical protein OEZ41_01770 [Nitrospirota bacterium]|nr:hypothetical protein [Nitrospirota bacterium]